MLDRLTPLLDPCVLSFPRRLTDVEAWQPHIPLAFFLVELLRPDVFVELGTHRGDSYCAFCQTVETLDLGTKCYAVDTWVGDAHTGPYGPEALEELRAHHDPLYGSFSTLLQMTFDEALHHFEDGEIDLLHIDGAHTYEAVSHDFSSWLPKVSARGVVVFHDTNARHDDFGVWRLWRELRERYRGFEVPYGHGLGVLAVGGEPDAKVDTLIDVFDHETTDATELFFALGERVAARGRATRVGTEVDALRLAHTAATEALRDRDAELADLHESLELRAGRGQRRAGRGRTSSARARGEAGAVAQRRRGPRARARSGQAPRD